MAEPVKNQHLLDKMAKRIKTLREARGLTQEEFYHDTGIHISRLPKVNSTHLLIGFQGSAEDDLTQS